MIHQDSSGFNMTFFLVESGNAAIPSISMPFHITVASHVGDSTAGRQLYTAFLGHTPNEWTLAFSQRAKTPGMCRAPP